MNNQFYIGFSSFEDLLSAIEKKIAAERDLGRARPALYIENLVATQPGPIANIRIRQFYVIATVVMDTAECWYWRMPVQNVDDWGDVGNSKEKLKDAQEKAELVCAIVNDHAIKSGYNVIPASVAFPRDLELISGTTTLFRYDKESKKLVPQAAAEGVA